MAKKKKHHHEEHIDESWLIPYADLLTLLLALFIVLFASSQMDAKKFEQLSRSLNEAFTGGTGVLSYPSAVDAPDSITPDPKDATTAPDARQTNANMETQTETEREKATEQQQQAEQKEQENMENLKKSIDQYIQENQLTESFQTQLLPDGVKIVIRDLAFFQSGTATIRPEAVRLAQQMSYLLAAYPRQVIVSGHTDNRPINNAEFESNWDLSSKRALNFMKILLQNNQLDPKNFSAIGYGEYHPVVPNDSDLNRANNRRVEVFIQRAH